ncbi:MAG: alpha/beta hydrolase [Gammaproteobacteria bacterium]|nr:alpha/beta hydrolase [Gammaproteobacteria bacterium]
MLVREQRVQIPGPAGALEAMYLATEGAQGVALLCHPNPQQGGTMLNKVVSTLQRTARDQGLATLRFNYRGTGNSEGEHDMASGEVDDAEAALAWLQERHPGLPVYLFGFSFGGFVAASLSGRLELRGEPAMQICLAAPAVTRLVSPHWLAGQGRLTVIQPEQDEVIDPQQVYDWAQAQQRPLQLVRIADSGHFFHGKLVELKEAVLRHVFDTEPTARNAG